MSLIVRIAHEQSRTITGFAHGLRRVLTRERRLYQADKVEEFDGACIDWYIRQPGLSATEKAAYNGQKLKAVVRREFVDTLENRVLKDFLKRCITEVRDYLGTCSTELQKQSARAKKVQQFGKICSSLLEMPAFDSISSISGLVSPNYALQSDPRYRKIWRHYCQLLKKQRTYDQIWACQCRVWQDSVALTIGVSLFRLAQRAATGKTEWSMDPISETIPVISFEQRDGLRLNHGTLPGPYLIKRRGAGMEEANILEIVSRDLFRKYLDTRGDSKLKPLTGVQPDFTLVFSPLSGQKPTFVFFWSCHALAEGTVDSAGMLQSMRKTLWDLGAKVSGIRTFGIALINKNGEVQDPVDPSKTFTLELDARVSGWSANIALLTLELEDLIGAIL